jgi:anion-transporting  ArsA/GET3 family ATPase
MTVEAVDLDHWLQGRRLVVCVGAGGVGKTTTAAAIGLHAARRGRRAIVLTIDPARRLATSLGLAAFGGEERRIDLSPLAEDVTGELWALMLDSRSAFDALMTRLARDEETRDRILGNHVYRHMADTFAGSQDYMATEKLFDLVTSGRWDLIVLDTPPVKNALDFLESPGRLVNFLDERVLRWFLRPSGGTGLLFGASAVVQRLLGAVFGRDFVDDLGVFFHDFQGLYAGFVERHTAVLGLLRAPTTSFLVVTAPTEPALDVAVFFLEEMAHRRLPWAGVVVNQVHHTESSGHDARVLLGARAAALAADLPPATVPGLLARLGMAHRRLAALSTAEQRWVGRVRRAAAGGVLQSVPRQDEDVHDLVGLRQIGAAIFGRTAVRC